MSNANDKALAAPTEQHAIQYVPLGEQEAIKITVRQIKQYLATPTRSGVMPNESDCIKFAMLCKARELNPWVGDAYLIGYDTKDGPQFSLITAIQALLKRAEMNSAFDGLEGGIVVMREKGHVEQRIGTIVMEGSRREVRHEEKVVFRTARKHKGISAGARNAVALPDKA